MMSLLHLVDLAHNGHMSSKVRCSFSVACMCFIIDRLEVDIVGIYACCDGFFRSGSQPVCCSNQGMRIYLDKLDRKN